MIPRIIWIYWDKGEKNAPFIIKKCIESWRSNNKKWDVRLIDKETISNFIDIEVAKEKFDRLSIQIQSDVIRISLLKIYGGVWVDASAYCPKSLDSWLYDICDSGFFMFSNPGPDRLIASWFIAAEKENYILITLYDYFINIVRKNKFYFKNRTLSKIKRKVYKFVKNRFNKNIEVTKYWLNPICLKIFRIYPYFLFHYCFNHLVLHDKRFNKEWSIMKKVSAENSHFLQKKGLLSIPTDEIMWKIYENEILVHKLNYRFDESNYSNRTLLGRFLEFNEKGNN